MPRFDQSGHAPFGQIASAIGTVHLPMMKPRVEKLHAVMPCHATRTGGGSNSTTSFDGWLTNHRGSPQVVPMRSAVIDRLRQPLIGLLVPRLPALCADSFFPDVCRPQACSRSRRLTAFGSVFVVEAIFETSIRYPARRIGLPSRLSTGVGYFLLSARAIRFVTQQTT